MLQELHPTSDDLETYSLGVSSEADPEKVEQHLLFCQRCQNELALSDQYIRATKDAVAPFETMKRLRSIHITEDGPIFGAVHCGADGKWVARHRGRQLNGLRVCESGEEANEYLTDSFRQMFPENLYTERCRS
jgi:hypothetical protein